MTINEIIREHEGQVADVEICVAEGSIENLYTDRIRSVEGLDQDHDYEFEEIAYHVMDEEDYDRTILANTGEYADFADWYDDEDAKVLVIAIRSGCEVYEPTPADRIKAIRKLTELSQTKFGERYGIPMRTIQNWETGVSEAPEYVLDMLEQIVWEAHEKERLFWGVVDSYDGGWDCDEYASKAEALKAGTLSWSRTSKHDQDRRTEFYVGLMNEEGEAFVIAKQWK